MVSSIGLYLKAQTTIFCKTYAIFLTFQTWQIHCFTIHAGFHGSIILTEIASKWFSLIEFFKALQYLKTLQKQCLAKGPYFPTFHDYMECFMIKNVIETH